MFSLGCEKKETQYDTPEKVAAIFWGSIQDKDVETAIAQIYEPVRPQLEKMIASDIKVGNIPTLPTELKFEVEQTDDLAIAVIANSDGVASDLIRYEGRWWVR